MNKKRFISIILFAVLVTVFSSFVICIVTLPEYLKINVKKIMTHFEKESSKDWRSERIAYLKNKEPPELSPDEVVKLLAEKKLIKSKKLYDVVDWYVYQGNRHVIEQVILNRQYELKETIKKGKIPKDQITNVTIVETDYYPGPNWGTDKERLILHQVMHKCARKEKVYPRYIYWLLYNIDPFKNESFKVCWDRLLFYDEIKSLLLIYSKYRGYPEIRTACQRAIDHYPCGWSDFSTVDKTLKIVDSNGPEEGFKFYIDRYNRNYHYQDTTFYDYSYYSYLNEAAKKAKKYGAQSVKHREPNEYYYQMESEGWSSENIQINLRIFDVNTKEPVIGIDSIRKAYSVSLDGVDITKNCKVAPRNILVIPLKPGKILNLKLTVSVTPRWWDDYVYIEYHK